MTWHGRWNRYEWIDGELYKLCNGPLHKEEGELMPLRSFWIMKKGPRAGKPTARCMACERVYRGRDIGSGLVEVDRVWFVLEELKARIGKAETCRRLGVSPNLWYRIEKRIYRRIYRRTARAAMLLLRELREQGVVRHKDSIRHGATARGRIEKIPRDRREFNGYDETVKEKKRIYRETHPEYKG